MIERGVTYQEGGHEKATSGWVSCWREEKAHRGNRNKHPFEEKLYFLAGNFVLLVFSCPDKSLRQLYTYPCHYLTTDKDLLLFDIKEQPKRLVNFETYNQSDYET